MKTKLIIEYLCVCFTACILLWALWLILFKKPPLKPFLKKYLKRVSLGMIAYVLGLGLANYLYAPQLPYKYWLILLPILPLLYVCFAIIDFVSDMDEMKRKIAVEAMAFAGLATGFTCFSYIFLRQSGGPEISLDYAFYVMWAYYFIGLFFSWRRYK